MSVDSHDATVCTCCFVVVSIGVNHVVGEEIAQSDTCERSLIGDIESTHRSNPLVFVDNHHVLEQIILGTTGITKGSGGRNGITISPVCIELRIQVEDGRP